MVRHKLSLRSNDLESLWDKLQPIYDEYEKRKGNASNEMEADDLMYDERAATNEASLEHGIRLGLMLSQYMTDTDRLTLRFSDEAGVNALIERLLERR